jgi:hypothetical protein
MTFDIFNTSDNGYDTLVKRYYVNLLMMTQKSEITVVVSCSEFDPIELEVKDLTIEFINANNKTIPMAFDVQMFDSIQLAAYDMFDEIKKDELQVSGAI